MLALEEIANDLAEQYSFAKDNQVALEEQSEADQKSLLKKTGEKIKAFFRWIGDMLKRIYEFFFDKKAVKDREELKQEVDAFFRKNPKASQASTTPPSPPADGTSGAAGDKGGEKQGWSLLLAAAKNFNQQQEDLVKTIRAVCEAEKSFAFATFSGDRNAQDRFENWMSFLTGPSMKLLDFNVRGHEDTEGLDAAVQNLHSFIERAGDVIGIKGLTAIKDLVPIIQGKERASATDVKQIPATDLIKRVPVFVDSAVSNNARMDHVIADLNARLKVVSDHFSKLFDGFSDVSSTGIHVFMRTHRAYTGVVGELIALCRYFLRAFVIPSSLSHAFNSYKNDYEKLKIVIEDCEDSSKWDMSTVMIARQARRDYGM